MDDSHHHWHYTPTVTPTGTRRYDPAHPASHVKLSNQVSSMWGFYAIIAVALIAAVAPPVYFRKHIGDFYSDLCRPVLW